jgi:hypothetical protein
MLVTVTYYKIGNMKKHIICRNLRENFISQRYTFCLIFEYGARLTVSAKKHRITPEALLSHPQFHLICHQCCRIAFHRHKVVYEMLTHPFLWRECHETMTQDIKHLMLAILRVAYAYVRILREVQ